MQRAHALYLVILGGLALLQAALSLGWPMIHDSPLLHYAAWRIETGSVPYRDIFDMNFPGTYLLFLGIRAVFGESDAGWRAFDLSWLVATSAILWAVCRAHGVRAAATAIALFWLFHLGGGPANTGQRDFIMASLLLAAGWWAIGSYGERGPRAIFAGGVAAGAACTIKPHAALWAVLLLMLLARAPGRAWRRPIAFSAGCAVPVAAVLAWLATLGGWPGFLDVFGGYVLPVYGKVGRLSAAEWAQSSPFQLGGVAAAGALAFLAVAQGGLARAGNADRLLLLAGVLFGAVHYFAQGRGWGYHAYPLILFGAALAGHLAPAALGGRRPIAGALVAWLLVAGGALGARCVVRLGDGARIQERRAEVESMAAELSRWIPPGGAAQVFDTTAGGIHALLLLHVTQPTRFLYDFPYLTRPEEPAVRRLRAELLGDLERSPPAALLVLRYDWPLGEGFAKLDRFPALSEWIRAGYRLEVDRGRYRIYARRSDP